MSRGDRHEGLCERVTVVEGNSWTRLLGNTSEQPDRVWARHRCTKVWKGAFNIPGSTAQHSWPIAHSQIAERAFRPYNPGAMRRAPTDSRSHRVPGSGLAAARGSVAFRTGPPNPVQQANSGTNAMCRMPEMLEATKAVSTRCRYNKGLAALLPVTDHAVHFLLSLPTFVPCQSPWTTVSPRRTSSKKRHQHQRDSTISSEIHWSFKAIHPS